MLFSSGWLTWFLSFPCPALAQPSRQPPGPRVLAGKSGAASSRCSRPQSRNPLQSPRKPKSITRRKHHGSEQRCSSPAGEETFLRCVEGRSQHKRRTRGAGHPRKGPEQAEDHGVRVRTGPTPELHGSTRGHRWARVPLKGSASPTEKA